MRHIKSSERRSNVSEIRQLLQTLHKEFFQNRQIIDKNDERESIVLLIKRLLNNFRIVKKTSHRNIRVIVFLSRDVITHNTEDCENRVLMIKRSQK
jgi:hypothetical protein